MGETATPTLHVGASGEDVIVPELILLVGAPLVGKRSFFLQHFGHSNYCNVSIGKELLKDASISLHRVFLKVARYYFFSLYGHVLMLGIWRVRCGVMRCVLCDEMCFVCSVCVCVCVCVCVHVCSLYVYACCVFCLHAASFHLRSLL